MAGTTAIYGLLHDVVGGEGGDELDAASWNTLADTIEGFLVNSAELLGEGCFLATDFNGAGETLSPGRAIVGPAGQRRLVVATAPVPITGLVGGKTNYVWLRQDGTAVATTTGVAPERSLLVCTRRPDGSYDQLPAGRRNLVSALAVRVAADDAEAGWLADKVRAGAGVSIATIMDADGRQALEIASATPVVTTQIVSGHVDRDLLVGGDWVEVWFDHSAQGSFESIVDSRAWAEDPETGTLLTDVQIIPLLHGADGSYTDGERMGVLVRVLPCGTIVPVRIRFERRGVT